MRHRKFERAPLKLSLRALGVIETSFGSVRIRPETEA
jgi:hypothetical protein